MFLCGFAFAAGNYPGPGSAAARAGDSAAGWNIYADAQRRLLVADERSRADDTRNSAALTLGCGGVRGIFEDDDPDVPVREADPFHDSAGPDHAEAERFAAAQFPDATVPVAVF